ncbi:hypothetical protein [Pedobacter insulae]|uniref:Uncharacterized protein n=1 Tax=Pedobacter insulae TaxID=414048 RepID=A0A1I2X512_9SPHI|nr:hypothetical protein [Pedobacter insulae]SFH08598.1 hypothetical protein SAMN04489864_1052 [Pedobacter insulae]
MSKDILISSSKEFTCAVLIHEVLHAYFRQTTAKEEAFNELDHQTIASSYIEPMAEFISGLYGISLPDAMALSWNGVRGTKAFRDATSFTIGSGTGVATLSKQDVLDQIRDYTLKLNGKGQGLCQ